MFDQDKFLDCMSRVATSVSVVTTKGPTGRAGVTVSALTSVTADRPSILICVHNASPACDAIRDNGVFCANVLREDQSHISECFAGRTGARGDDKFACADWIRLATGAPALADAMVALDCTVMQALDWGTHRIFIGEIVDAEIAEGSPLIYTGRAYATARSPIPDTLAAAAS